MHIVYAILLNDCLDDVHDWSDIAGDVVISNPHPKKLSTSLPFKMAAVGHLRIITEGKVPSEEQSSFR